MRASPKVQGEKSEGLILAALLRAGKVVLLPFGDNQRYDLVIDEHGKFVRVQCKTGRLRQGAINFKTCSSHEHRGKGTRNYYGQADLFGVYCPETDAVYFIPVEEVGTTRALLRVEPPKNNQKSKTRYADRYKLPA